MKETVTKVIDMLIQEDVHRANNKYIAAGDYFEGD